MNSIKRARSHPRVASVNFRTLWWVLQREAGVQIFMRSHFAVDELAIRQWLGRVSTVALRGICARRLRHCPQTRFTED